MLAPRSLLFASLLLGCGSEAPPAAVPVAPPPAPVVVAPPPVPTPALASAEKVADGKVGVEVCDAYLEVHRGCIAGLAEGERKVHGAALEEQRLAWLQARGDAKAGAGLAEACAAARTAAKVALPDCKGW